MKIKMELVASDEEERFDARCEMEEVDKDTLTFALATAFNAFGIIKHYGVYGGAEIVARALSLAEILHNSDGKLENIEADLDKFVEEMAN